MDVKIRRSRNENAKGERKNEYHSLLTRTEYESEQSTHTTLVCNEKHVKN